MHRQEILGGLSCYIWGKKVHSFSTYRYVGNSSCTHRVEVYTSQKVLPEIESAWLSNRSTLQGALRK